MKATNTLEDAYGCYQVIIGKLLLFRSLYVVSITPLNGKQQYPRVLILLFSQMRLLLSWQYDCVCRFQILFVTFVTYVATIVLQRELNIDIMLQKMLLMANYWTFTMYYINKHVSNTKLMHPRNIG